MRSLLDAGANPNAQAIGGVAPLHAAAEAGSLDCASALLKVCCQGLTYGRITCITLQCTIALLITVGDTWVSGAC